jgi:uncharacterized protein YegL
MGITKEAKQLIPRANTSKAKLDVLVLVDGSGSVDPADFQRERQLCLAIAARLGKDSQLGVVQFGNQAKLESSLTLKIEELEKKLESMVQVGGGTNLNAAFTHCVSEFGLSRQPNNSKQVWIVTDGNYDDVTPTALAAQKLKREQQATIFAIGVGPNVTVSLLNRVTSPGCSFLVQDFEGAFKILKGEVKTTDLSIQMEAQMTFPNALPARLGEEVFLKLRIENVGRQRIPQGSRIIFKDNPYFKEKFAIIQKNIQIGEDIELDVKLVPKTKGNKSNLDSQLLALPEVLELLVFDADNNQIECDCSGYFINHEDFSGDIYQYKPLYGVKCANVITFGPPGAGKSSFVNSVCSSLTDHILALNVAGATRNVVTAGLLRFPLYLIPDFADLNFALYDVPGVDGQNYKGDEMAMMLHGMLPYSIDFKHDAARFADVEGKRNSEEEEFNRRAHVVAFFVPQGAAGDSDLMQRLSGFFYHISVEHRRKVIVIISHADEISGEEERKEILGDVCQKLSIDSSSVFFLENYVDTKVKQFHVDKSVLRILLAMINRADDFLTFDRLNPTPSPCPKHPGTSYAPPSPQLSPPEPKGKSPQLSPEPKGKSPQLSPDPKGKSPQKSGGLEAILEKLPETLRQKLDGILKEEEIDDEESFRSMNGNGWKSLGLKMGDVIKIENALKN